MDEFTGTVETRTCMFSISFISCFTAHVNISLAKKKDSYSVSLKDQRGGSIKSNKVMSFGIYTSLVYIYIFSYNRLVKNHICFCFVRGPHISAGGRNSAFRPLFTYHWPILCVIVL